MLFEIAKPSRQLCKQIWGLEAVFELTLEKGAGWPPGEQWRRTFRATQCEVLALCDGVVMVIGAQGTGCVAEDGSGEVWCWAG